MEETDDAESEHDLEPTDMDEIAADAAEVEPCAIENKLEAISVEKVTGLGIIEAISGEEVIELGIIAGDRIDSQLDFDSNYFDPLKVFAFI